VRRQNKTPVPTAKNRGLHYHITFNPEGQKITGIYGKVKGIRCFLAYEGIRKFVWVVDKERRVVCGTTIVSLLKRCTMELFQPGEIVELKSGRTKMTIIAVDNSSGEATCLWFEGKNRNEEIFDVGALRKINQRKPNMRIYPRGR
jgi:uncharacterized protein YodC (DUF2158 family)